MAQPSTTRSTSSTSFHSRSTSYRLESVNQQSIPTLLDRIPKVVSGTLYKYLSCGENQSKTFRALFKGYNQWASGRIERININTSNPLYCFVRCAVIPSMKDGTYKTTLLLRKAPTGYGTVQTATCECAAE